MIKHFSILSIFWVNSLLAFDFESHDDFSAFEGKPVVALWRGTYFSPSHFATDQDQQNYINAHGPQVPLYCAASHRTTKVSYTELLTPRKIQILEESVTQIQTIFKAMETSAAITIDRKQFSNHRHAFQQIYSNSTDFIAALGEEVIPASYRKHAPFLKNLPKGNPLLSFSTDVTHAGKYGYGLKDYGHIDSLSSLYDATGHRQHTYVGYLQGVFLTDDIAKYTMPYDVVRHHKEENINISHHFSNDILSEKEVSMVGKMLGQAVVLTLPLEIPDLSGPYPGEYRSKFGLTKRKYDNIRALITDPDQTAEKKQERITRMLKEIISPAKEDDGLVYTNTLVHKAKATLEKTFDQFDDFQKGRIGLDGRVYDPDQHA